jgi:arabinogalactan oligomer / maltooligosaccharide transport system permease protein
MNRRDSLWVSAGSHAVAIALTVFALYPVMWVVSLAFSGAVEDTARIIPIPHAPTLDNFRQFAGGAAPGGLQLFLTQLGNSLLVSLATALIAIVIATPTAYALARMPFLGKDAAVRGLLATQMFPAVASAVPLYLVLERLHLLDSRLGLILVYATTAIPFAIFQLRSAFEAIPIELEEAARVDGASRFQAFLLVALPAARPALAVTGLFAFMSAWNEFILAATLLSRKSAFTLPVVLQAHIGEHASAWGVFAAGALVVSTPVMALFYLVQRQMIAGLTAGGVKG